MKHLDDGHAEYLNRLLNDCGIIVPVNEQGLMLRHLDWILEWNSKINLTAITEPMEAVRLHIVDSLLAVEMVNACPHGPMFDLGSGPGFPGVPLALATRRNTTLIESVKKKARVVSAFVDSLEDELPEGLLSVAPVRAEEHAATNAETAVVVTARALSQLGSLIELASPLLATGGALVALKGALSEDELDNASAVAGMTGMKVESLVVTQLPEDHETRSLVTVRKVGRSKVALPRRTGQAQREPLVSASRGKSPHL